MKFLFFTTNLIATSLSCILTFDSPTSSLALTQMACNDIHEAQEVLGGQGANITVGEGQRANGNLETASLV